ncbi:hypothetical protein PAFU01_18640 [Pantoea ananatis]|nr:hypothetical protein PAFU01_18640 [Pantoea ananatis]
MRAENQARATVERHDAAVQSRHAELRTALPRNAHWNIDDSRAIHRVIPHGIRFSWFALSALKTASLNANPGWLTGALAQRRPEGFICLDKIVENRFCNGGTWYRFR